ncbi:hypothetical protein H7U31_10130 [Olsenella uli]|nr:hypothetical protein [Olsenella uli]
MEGGGHDNARAEGFFGTPECDFFEGRDWTGAGFEEFAAKLDGCIEWCRSGKLKKSLGWKTIRRSREELGYAAWPLVRKNIRDPEAPTDLGADLRALRERAPAFDDVSAMGQRTSRGCWRRRRARPPRAPT